MARRRRHVWRAGSRSSRSIKMDQYRQSKEPWEVAGKKKGVVKKHYSTSKKGRAFLVRRHKRRR